MRVKPGVDLTLFIFHLSANGGQNESLQFGITPPFH